MKTVNNKFYRRYIEPTFPAAIYDDITPQEFMVMTVLYSDYDYDEKCATVSRRDIAQTCNMSVRNIDRILSQLVKKDLYKSAETLCAKRQADRKFLQADIS